jgi:hypothetical protein
MIVLTREDAEVHLHSLQYMTEQIQLCGCGHCRLGKLDRCSELTSGSLDTPDDPTSPLQ